MNMKMILFILALTLAGSSFATTASLLKDGNYAGTIQEEQLGQATLTEINRSSTADQKISLVLKAKASADSQDVLKGADFVQLSLDMANAKQLVDGLSIPTIATVQSNSPEDEEICTHVFRGSCNLQFPRRQLNCAFDIPANQNQHLQMEIQ